MLFCRCESKIGMPTLFIRDELIAEFEIRKRSTPISRWIGEPREIIRSTVRASSLKLIGDELMRVENPEKSR
jgi:hypothetical protein